MIVDVGQETIDFSKVERVGPVGGDTAWLRYTVYFTGGGTVFFYEDRSYSNRKALCPVAREKFIELWKTNTK